MQLFKPLIFVSTFTLLSIAGTAQKPGTVVRCSTMDKLEKTFERDPSLKTRFEQERDEFNNAVRQGNFPVRGNGSRVTTVTYIVPVVFHVISTNPAAITDAQILSQLDVLNKDFAGANADSTNVPSFFQPLFGHSPINFCLAQRNPNGEATTGIERTTTTQTSFNYINDGMKYASSGGADSWDPSKYFNVWVCTLSGGVLGYGTFPETGDPRAQGAVIDYRSMPGGVYADYNGGKTLTHEAGHYFNLYHVWGDDDGACTGTDYIDDTPNQANSTSGCYTGAHFDACTPSGNGIMYENYMDYSNDNCLVMFTPLQVVRMESALLAYRSSLLSSDGCVPVIQRNYDAALVSIDQPNGKICTSSLTPFVTIKNMGMQTLTTLSVYYTIDNGELNTYTWTGSLSYYQTAYFSLPAISSTEGNHQLQVYLVNPDNNPDENNTNDTLYKSFIYYHSVETVQEGFEESSFPPAAWDIINPDNGITWEKTTGIAHTGSSAVKINNFDYISIGQKDDLRLPLINIAADKDSAFLSFYVAAATYNPANTASNNWDTLELLLSTDCGANYISLYKKYDSSLITRTQPSTTAFVPISSEWRKDSVNLSRYIGAGDLLLAFRNTTGYENNIYLDDINLRTVTVNSNLKKQGFLVTPSPTTGLINVQFYPQPSKLASIQIFSITGQKLMETKIPTGQANNLYSYDLSGYPTGMYMVKAIFTDNVMVRKVIKN